VAEVPSLTTSGNVTVSAGGSKPLGITVVPNDSDDTVSVKISNVPSFETITAPSGDVVTRNKHVYHNGTDGPGNQQFNGAFQL